MAAFFLSFVSRHKPPALRGSLTIHLPVPRWIVDIETLGGNLNNVGERAIDQPRFIVSVYSLSIKVASQNPALGCVQIQAGNKVLRFITRNGRPDCILPEQIHKALLQFGCFKLIL